eukprot:3897441-Prymnesium_polylepis.1
MVCCCLQAAAFLSNVCAPPPLRSQNSQIDTDAKCKRVLDDAGAQYDPDTPPMKLRILASGVLMAAAGNN